MSDEYLSLAEIVEIEPRIGELIDACAQLPDGVCMDDAWYSDEFKGKLVNIVGWGAAGDGRLKSTEAYDVAYGACIAALPKCGGGRCFRCGKPLPADLSFDGIHPGGRAPVPAVATLSWIATLDMLGYSRRVLDADEHGNTNAVLSDLRRMIAEAYPFLGADPTSWRVKAYTDNVLVNVPIETSAFFELEFLCSALSRFQTAMLFHGQTVRGGVAFGLNYVDDDIAYGAGLIEAHRLEQSIAKVPRIVISPRARRFVAFFAGRVGEATGLGWVASTSPLMVDDDGQWFVDYLAPLTGRCGEPFDPVALSRHRDVVTSLRETHQANKRIRPKYEWLVRYHDAVCFEIHREEYAIEDARPEFPRPMLESDLAAELEAFLEASDGSLEMTEASALDLIGKHVALVPSEALH